MVIAHLPTVSPGDYAGADPFPHAVFDGLWDAALLERVADAAAAQSAWDGEKQFEGSRFKRWCSTWEKLPQPVLDLIAYASQPEFLRWLEKLTGETALVPDPYLEGAGIHSIGQGGFLKMHADFNWHEPLQLYRRLNVLIYLNQSWDEAWGGDLRLAAKRGGQGLDIRKTVFPHFNTTVVFTTDDDSFHGHPDPLTCPAEVLRNSIALYYYSAKRPSHGHRRKRKGTDYRVLDGSRLFPSSHDRLRQALAAPAALWRGLTGKRGAR